MSARGRMRVVAAVAAAAAAAAAATAAAVANHLKQEGGGEGALFVFLLPLLLLLPPPPADPSLNSISQQQLPLSGRPSPIKYDHMQEHERGCAIVERLRRVGDRKTCVAATAGYANYGPMTFA